jgi:ADP-ribosyl-[dinitrogen reductase] hydrolase
MTQSHALTPVQLDRAAGVLLGTAAGDALGAGYEFSHPTHDTEIDMIGGGPFGFAPGEWTDDTSMAIAVARVSATGADLRDPAALNAIAQGFRDWFDGGPRDVGNQTRVVLSQRSTTAEQMQNQAAALPGRTGGNGSLMRTAAVGLAYLDDPVGCAEAAAQVSLLTHADERAVQACQLWSHAIRHAVLEATFDGVRGYLHDNPDVAAYWNPLLDQAEAGEPADFANNGWVVHALQTAWWAICRASDTNCTQLQQALELCVRAGHDTDTTAAIAGGLLGARWGSSAVPQRWKRALHGWPGMVSRDLVALGVRTARKGADDERGWPSAPYVDFAPWHTGKVTSHPHDDGVLLGGAGAAKTGGFDVEVALCRMGSAEPRRERIDVWLIDADDANPNLEFVLDDTARTVRELRQKGKRVLVHGVEGTSRTPAVAARYSQLLAQDPRQLLDAMPWAKPRAELWEAVVGDEPDWAWRSHIVPEPEPRSVILSRRAWFVVRAQVRADGALEFAGQDLDPPEGLGSEYEYFLTVDATDIPLVVAALGGEPDDDVLDLLEAHGEQIVTTGEQTWLRSLGLNPGFCSYVSFD